MRQFKRVIHLFEEFKILCNEMSCLVREIKKHLKCMQFFEVFQLAKLEEIQIPSKKLEFEILLTQPHNHDRLGCPYDLDGSNRLDDTNGSSRPNNPDGSVEPNDLDRLGDPMTHMGRAILTTQSGQSSLTTHTVRAGLTTKMCRAGPTTQTNQKVDELDRHDRQVWTVRLVWIIESTQPVWVFWPARPIWGVGSDQFGWVVGWVILVHLGRRTRFQIYHELKHN